MEKNRLDVLVFISNLLSLKIRGFFLRRKKQLLAAWLLSLCFVPPLYADFINGGFEDPYDPVTGVINGWTVKGYRFDGNATNAAPTSIKGINLVAAVPPVLSTGISDIIAGPAETLFDYFLLGALPQPITQLLPIEELQSGMVNLRSINTPYIMAGLQDPKPTGPPPWTLIGQQATSFSQQIVVQASDFDPNDGIVHVRFEMAPVVENPAHEPRQQPFIAVQLNNITKG